MDAAAAAKGLAAIWWIRQFVLNAGDVCDEIPPVFIQHLTAAWRTHFMFTNRPEVHFYSLHPFSCVKEFGWVFWVPQLSLAYWWSASTHTQTLQTWPLSSDLRGIPINLTKRAYGDGTDRQLSTDKYSYLVEDICCGNWVSLQEQSPGTK